MDKQNKKLFFKSIIFHDFLLKLTFQIDSSRVYSVESHIFLILFSFPQTYYFSELGKVFLRNELSTYPNYTTN